jgi:hypothetical protein
MRMLVALASGEHFVPSLAIREYRPGNAFKRWLDARLRRHDPLRRGYPARRPQRKSSSRRCCSAAVRDAREERGRIG